MARTLVLDLRIPPATGVMYKTNPLMGASIGSAELTCSGTLGFFMRFEEEKDQPGYDEDVEKPVASASTIRCKSGGVRPDDNEG